MIKIISDRLWRWLWPPPARTACFSSARRPGVVFRVSNILMFGLFSMVMSCLVWVAMPERRWMKLSNVRSRINSDFTGPVSVVMRVPFGMDWPSLMHVPICMDGSMMLMLVLMMLFPKNIPVSFVINCAVLGGFLVKKELVVISFLMTSSLSAFLMICFIVFIFLFILIYF